ncbi:hypothetical protein RIF29_03337 [Crotalaria pallida]|uniref:Uncharacterized protein n=1 Tax=Crotalaria pallida TaxID=3830 RepID=A0AAN9J0K5_CROPI
MIKWVCYSVAEKSTALKKTKSQIFTNSSVCKLKLGDIKRALLDTKFAMREAGIKKELAAARKKIVRNRFINLVDAHTVRSLQRRRLRENTIDIQKSRDSNAVEFVGHRDVENGLLGITMQNWLSRISLTLLRVEPLYSKHRKLEIGGIEYSSYWHKRPEEQSNMVQGKHQSKEKGVVVHNDTEDLNPGESRSTVEATAVDEVNNEDFTDGRTVVMKILGLIKVTS